MKNIRCVKHFRTCSFVGGTTDICNKNKPPSDLLKSPSDTCSPYEYDSNNIPIVPCGSVANSMFNGMYDILMNYIWSFCSLFT